MSGFSKAAEIAVIIGFVVLIAILGSREADRGNKGKATSDHGWSSILRELGGSDVRAALAPGEVAPAADGRAKRSISAKASRRGHRDTIQDKDRKALDHLIDRVAD